MNMDFICPNCEELIKLSLRAAAGNAKRKCPVCGTPIEQEEVLRQRKLDRQILMEQMEQDRLVREAEGTRQRRWNRMRLVSSTVYSIVTYSLLLLPFVCCVWYWQSNKPAVEQDPPVQAQLNPASKDAAEKVAPKVEVLPEPMNQPEQKPEAKAVGDGITAEQKEAIKKAEKLVAHMQDISGAVSKAHTMVIKSDTLEEREVWVKALHSVRKDLKKIRDDIEILIPMLPDEMREAYRDGVKGMDKLHSVTDWKGADSKNPFAPQPAPEKSATETKKDMPALQKEIAEKSTTAVEKSLADLEKTKEIYRTAKDGSPNKTLAKPAIDRLTESLRKSLGDPQLDTELKKRIKEALAK